jgi:hypothetical protein
MENLIPIEQGSGPRRLANGAKGNRQTATKADLHEIRGLPVEIVALRLVSCETP